MIYSYDEAYLKSAVYNLGEALDCAVNGYGMSIPSFMAMFITCGAADDYGEGVPSVVSGISGTELVSLVLKKSGLNRKLPAIFVHSTGFEFWCGKALAYYQWLRCISFKDMMKFINPDRLEKLFILEIEYYSDETVNLLDSWFNMEDVPARVQKQRKISGHTQKSLAAAAEVNLRTLQQYELKSKDINKAAVSVVHRMAKTMGCEPEDLLEFNFTENTEKPE